MEVAQSVLRPQGGAPQFRRTSPKIPKRTIYMFSTRTSRRQVLPVLACALACTFVVSSCDDDDDDDVVVPSGPKAFTAQLSADDEIPMPIVGTRVRVSITNLAPDLGTFQTPVWVGFHDGNFDLYDLGAPAAMAFPGNNALESLAEDGDAGPLTDAFEDSDAGSTQATLGGMLGPETGPIAPGETVSAVFELDPSELSSAYFSYASMVIPSNDAFVANGSPTEHMIFDSGGAFVATDFVVAGSDVLDAGTEQNDELADNTAFFGQTTPNTGVDEGGNVGLHPGYEDVSSGGNILDDPMFAGADFTQPGYLILAFHFEQLPPGPDAFGTAQVELNAVESQVQVAVNVVGLSGPATGAHFHEAPPGMTGPIVLSLTDEIDVNDAGQVVIDAVLPTPVDFAQALKDGNIYLNVHTALNPDGEVRGQLNSAMEAFTGQLSTAAEVPAPVLGTGVRVTVTNAAPTGGTFQTPVWIGFHDGSFDIYDEGSPAATYFPTTSALERLAEDGNFEPLQEAFSAMEAGTVQGVASGILGAMSGPLAPGESVTRVFELDQLAAKSQYMSYASMVIPSNDAFVANGDPQAHPIFDSAGDFVAEGFIVDGDEALDAGTEQNDEDPANTAFFGQTEDNTGTDENGNVQAHPGFLDPGSGGNILADPMFANADFTAVGYDLLEFDFSQVEAGPPAAGVVTATLNETDTELSFTVAAYNLSGSVTGMHFHEGAPGIAGPILIDLTDTIEVNENGILAASGTVGVSPEFVTSLRDGEIYLNVHTGLNPSGEVRAQLTMF